MRSASFFTTQLTSWLDDRTTSGTADNLMPNAVQATNWGATPSFLKELGYYLRIDLDFSLGDLPQQRLTTPLFTYLDHELDIESGRVARTLLPA